MTSLTCSSRQARTQRLHWMQASRFTAIAGCERSSAGWRRAREARLADRQLLRPEIELGVERIGRLRHVRQQQLDRHLLAGEGPGAVGGDLHALLGIAAARRRQHALALDLHHAGAAVAVRPHALHVAEARDLDAVLLGGLEDRLVRAADHRAAVQRERDGIRRNARVLLMHHSTSRGKYFSTDSTGFGAAWPRPQIDASIIACDSSFSSGASHRCASISCSALTVPTRHGVHWPHDSSAKNFIRLRAAPAAVSWSDSIDDRRRADEAAVFVQRVEVERDVGLRRRQNSARGAARQVAVELVAFEHAAAVLVDELRQRDAGGREVHARLLDAAAHRERAQPLAAVAALAGEPLRPLLEDVAHPVQRLHVVLERGPAEQADLGHIRRPQARLAALALDRLDHRGLFAADVGAGAASQVNRRKRARRIRLQRGDLALQDRAAAVILVAQIDVDRVDADRPGGNERTFEKPVRVALEVVAVLERARLALVDVDGHQPRRRLGRHQLPLAAGREAGASEAAQARVLHHRDDVRGLLSPAMHDAASAYPPAARYAA